MVAPVISPIDPDQIPQRNGSQTQGEYSDNMDYFATELPRVVDDINTSTAWIDSTATTIDGSASAAAISAGNAADSAAAADASADAAAASAASAAGSPSTSATSSTSLTPGLGSKSLTLVETGKNFVVGQFVLIADTTAPTTKFLRGGITAFNSGTGAMTITVSDFAGSTSGTTWAVSLSSPPNTYGMPLDPAVVTGTTVSMASFGDYTLTNTGTASTATFPASPSPGNWVWVRVKTGRYDGMLGRNGVNIEGLAEDFILDQQGSTLWKYIDATYGWQLRAHVPMN